MKANTPDFASAFPEMLKEWDYDNNEKAPSDYSAVSTKTVSWICPKGHRYKTSINRRTKQGRGCPYCSGKKILPGYNDLATKFPKLATEWNYGRNGELTPKDVALTSNKKVWWRCKKCGHEWEALISNRGRGVGCPKCRYQKSVSTRYENNIKMNGSFADNYPELLLDWDYEKNNKTVHPTDVVPGSNLRVYWKCHKCGHEWISSINNRSRGSQCLKCSYKTRQSSNRKPKQA